MTQHDPGRWRSPPGCVATIAGAGHYPNLERPEEWAELVGDFLTQLGIPTPR